MATALPQLHDVRNPEALCQSILASVLNGNGGFWSPEDREDIMQELRLLIVRLADRYDQSLTTMSFSTYATWIIRRRAGVDAYRDRLVDKRYHKERPPDISLDELRERLDGSVAFEENDETPTREQADILTRLACSMTVVDVSSIEIAEAWRESLNHVEAQP